MNATGCKENRPEGRPECYGDPQQVCPRDEAGLMQPQPGCISCSSLKPCLQHALRKQGLIEEVTEEEPTPQDLANARPACFADPEQVCPRDETGIIQPQVRCISCASFKPCLQQALQRQGVLVEKKKEAEAEEARQPLPPAVSKVSRFMKRWSDQKLAKESSSDKDSPRSS